MIVTFCLLVFPLKLLQLQKHWLRLLYSAEGVPEPMSLLEPEQLTPGMTNTTNAVIARLKDFHNLLRQPPQVKFFYVPDFCKFRHREAVIHIVYFCIVVGINYDH